MLGETGVGSSHGGVPAGMSEEGFYYWRVCHGRPGDQASLPWGFNLASQVSPKPRCWLGVLGNSADPLGGASRASSGSLMEQQPDGDALAVIELGFQWGAFL